MKLFGKNDATALISSMISRGRLSHAYIICGPHGAGKKTLALSVASQILCEKQSGEPCGVCKSCRMLKNNAHPDFITVSPSGKNGNYRADDLRPIISEASVMPNEGEKKIYFLPRIDKALPAAQNVLLKIVEEPPRHVVFIMTAESRQLILPTILSRTVSLFVGEVSKDDCVSALEDHGVSHDDAESAVKLFGGNIGKCLEYVSDEEARILPETVGEITSALVGKDEYALLLKLSSLEKDRELCLAALSSLKDVVRDALTAKYGAKGISMCRESALKLSEKLRAASLEKIYSDISEAEDSISKNASAQLVLSALCGKISVNL